MEEMKAQGSGIPENNDDVFAISQPSNHSPKTPPFFYGVVTLAVIGGFLFGYDTGVVASGMLVLRRIWDMSDQWHELLVSVTIGVAALFALVGGITNHYLGRKPTILISGALFTAGPIIIAASPNKECMLIGRIVVGMGLGMSSMTVPAYVAEVSPPKVRGRMVTAFQLFITMGFFVSGILCGCFTFVQDDNISWRLMFGFAAIPALLQTVGFWFMPGIHGSHVFIAMMKHRSSRNALFIGCIIMVFQELCGINTIMFYSSSIVRMAGIRNYKHAIWFVVLTSGVNFLCTFPSLYIVERFGRRKLLLASIAGVITSCLILALGFFLISHSSAPITAHNDNSICASSRIQTCDDCSYESTCGFCYSSDSPIISGQCLLVDSTNKSLPLGEFSLNETTKCSYAHKELYDSSAIFASGWCPSTYAWIPILGMVLFLCSFSVGFGPIPWLINAEVFPLWARSTGNSISTFVNWACNLVIAQTFLTLSYKLTRQGAFLLYGSITLIGWIVLFCTVPETKRKTLEDLEAILKQPLFSRFRKSPCVKDLEEKAHTLPSLRL